MKTKAILLGGYFCVLVFHFQNFWFAPKSILLTSSAIIFSLLVFQFPILAESLHRHHLKSFIYSLLFFLMIILPIQNLSWGDGILLLQTNYLESRLFGFQFSLDEIGEGAMHSFARFVLEIFLDEVSLDLPFRLVSTLAGFWFLFRLIKIENSLPFVSSSGILLFFGYLENYSLVSLLLFLHFFWLFSKYKTFTKKDMVLGTLLACFISSFHLIGGHLAFVYLFIWWKKSRKVSTAILCGSLSLIWFGLLFGYFLFVHDPPVDRMGTHLLHPPIYPWKRMISMNHLKEMLSVIWFVGWAPVLATLVTLSKLGYQKLKEFASLPENQIVLIGILAFSFHLFRHNPMLGYPADWDLMGFLWIPSVIWAYSLNKSFPQLSTYYNSIWILSILLTIVFAYENSNLRIDLPLSQRKRMIDEFVLIWNPKSYASEHRKFGAKMDFFYFEKERETDCEALSDLHESLLESQREWNQGEPLSNKTIPDFLNRLTLLHTLVIERSAKAKCN